MKLKLLLLTTGLTLCSQGWAASPITKPINDVQDQRDTLVALTGATVYVDANNAVEDATVLVKNGRIVSVKKQQKPPSNAFVKDYSGLFIYPGFIHLDSSVGLPEVKPRSRFNYNGKEVINSTREGAYNGNEAIKASFNAAEAYKTDSKANKALRSAGFTNALIHNKDGIMRGTSALINLSDQADQLNLMNTRVAAHYSFDKGSSQQNYPISLMGSVALIRQTLMDADWYQKQKSMTDLDLAAINQHKKLPRIFSSNTFQQTALVKKIKDEFDIDFAVRTRGDSYQDLSAIKELGSTLIVPLNTSKAPRVDDPYDIWSVDLKDLKKWEVQPFNPALLEQNNINFALLPADDDADGKKFLEALNTAVEHGLTKQTALAAITSVPAKIIAAKDLGHLKPGAHANMVVTTGDLFSKDAQIAETWVAGISYTVNGIPVLTSGQYTLNFADQSYQTQLSLKKGKVEIKDMAEDSETTFDVSMDGSFINIFVKQDDATEQLFGLLDNGRVMALDQSQQWSFTQSDADNNDAQDKANRDQSSDESKALPEIPYPFSAYGYAEKQSYDNVVFKNATVWTNTDAGILEQTDVLVSAGKIKAVGENLAAGNAKVIDATGKHLTAGIIDEHSHIALLSVNDFAVNSSMVRMNDVVNPHDVNIYRNLAGGVTAAQLLHGSANPIGGQSALVKLHWGASQEEMIIDNADGFIKFALGENVKRSSNSQSVRYPLTRMGVEQVYRDAFSQAQLYAEERRAYEKMSNKNKANIDAPRRDLSMEPLLEILNEERFISCHSYVQSEINMLMHVAEDFDFRVNTFTHILEGYKVADKMAEHGAGASTFADWWAYKWEVNYAIPYNAALMTRAGVVTAINSDDAEMSRRLNQEAAKSVKYGGLSEEEAWKLVTLNPAKLLRLDDRMGSIQKGMDADVVLWSDNPLSIYAKAEKTLVDGIIYFDRSKLAETEAAIMAEKKRLMDKVNKLDSKDSIPFKTMPEQTLHCDSMHALEAGNNWLMKGEIL